MRLIKLNEENVIVSIRKNASQIFEGEIESELGEIGQKLIDGVFYDVEEEEEEGNLDIKEKILFNSEYQIILLEMLNFN